MLERIGFERLGRRGNVAIEAAIALPFLFGVMLLTLDVIRYLDASARIERAAAVAADLSARSKTLVDYVDFTKPRANDELAMLFLAANEAAYPDELPESGRVYLSAVRIDSSGGARVLWQRTGPYALAEPSRLSAGKIPALPGGGTYIVAEVFYDFKPLLLDAPRIAGVLPRVLYRQATFRPRLTALATLQAPEG